MDNFPKRPTSHSNGDKAVSLFRELCPSNWIVHEIFNDYGLDLRIELVKNGVVYGQEFYVQIKSIKIQPKEIINIQIRPATINYWLAKLKPVAIIGVDINKRQFIFEWLENAYENYPNYSENDKLVKLGIPSVNVAQKFEKDTYKYVSEFFLKLSTDLAEAFENTQLSRILFHASELHRLVSKFGIYLYLANEQDLEKVGKQTNQFLFEFSLHDKFFEDMIDLYKTKKLDRLNILTQQFPRYKKIRDKFYMKEKAYENENGLACVPISYTELSTNIFEIMYSLDTIVGILLQLLLLGKCIFPVYEKK